MNAIVGRIQIGTWELGGNVLGAGVRTGSAAIHSTVDCQFTGLGGSSPDRFKAILGLINLGSFEPGSTIQGATGSSTRKVGTFSSPALLTIVLAAPSPGSRFNADAVLSVNLRAVPHINFDCNAKVSTTFKCVGTLNSRFTTNAVTAASFISSAIDYPRVRIGMRTNVEFFVRQGQGPSCYYDNGFIDPNTKIFNYVF